MRRGILAVVLGCRLQGLQIERTRSEMSPLLPLCPCADKILQIPGWNAAAESMKVQGNYGYDACDHRYTDALPPRVEDQQELWANRSDFIDAAMHEELIWMEAAAACDACTEVEVCKAQAAHCNSRCTSADDVLCAVSSDVDDWYTGDIEAEISKLEQQQQALAEAQCSFEAALLQWRPVVSAHSE